MTRFDPRALGLVEEERVLLETYGFDAETFERLWSELREGRFPPERNLVDGPVEPPAASDLTDFPQDAEGEELERLGAEAIDRGEVALCILNGGMATRFGGVVKGTVEVLDGQSFLGLKLRDVRDRPAVPVFLMDSFATDEATGVHLEAHRFFGLEPSRIHRCTQHISIRLRPDGEIFRTRDGRVSFYAPGHGDVFDVLASFDAFQGFVRGGGRMVLISNVDNLGATLAPKVVGMHLRAGRPVTVEVAPRAPKDKGGAPLRYRGRLQLLEGFRLPPTFDLNRVSVFNTNTMLVNVEAIRADYPLRHYRADKHVEGRLAVQFERLMGEVTAFVDATYLTVPRDGPEGRFMPVKTPEDLIAIRPAVRERLGLERVSHF